MRKTKASTVAAGGMIASLYIILTLVSTSLGLASGLIQIRLSEMLCILPCFTPAAVPGLFVGCMAANLLSGCAAMDVIFGSIATFLGALGTRLLRRNRWLAALPPILCNSLIIPVILKKVYGFQAGAWVLVLSVFAGELLSAGVLGELLYSAFAKYKDRVNVK